VEPCLKKVALNKVILASEKSDKAKSRPFKIECVIFEKGHLWYFEENI
jgi:hypothetical protein